MIIQTSFCTVFDNKFLTCALYVNCFILSLTFNRHDMVAAFYMYRYMHMVGVVKHWMHTDVHVSVSRVSVSESFRCF